MPFQQRVRYLQPGDAGYIAPGQPAAVQPTVMQNIYNDDANRAKSHTIGYALAALAVLGLGLAAWSGGAFTSERGWDAIQAVGVAKANAKTGTPSLANGDGIAAVGIANANARAGAPSNADGGVNENIGVARANAQAHMGSNSANNGVNAVRPNVVRPAPAPASLYVPQAAAHVQAAQTRICSIADSTRGSGAPRWANSVPMWNPNRNCCDWRVPPGSPRLHPGQRIAGYYR